MPLTDPRNPSIEKWLYSLEPRQELVLRFAMRWRFAEVRADRTFGARVEELRDLFDQSRLALILADANLMSEQIEQVLGAAT